MGERRAFHGAELVRALEDLGRSFAPADDRDLAELVLARVRDGDPARGRRTMRRFTPRAPRPIVGVAAAVIVALVVVLAFPGPRDSVARLLRIGGVELSYRGDVPPGLDGALDLGAPITITEALDRVDGLPVVPAALGRPAAGFAGRPRGAVTLVWAPSAALPEVADAGVGLLLSTFPGTTDRDLVGKQLLPGTTLEQVSVDGAPAFWISGARHVFVYLDADGEAQLDTARLAANTLLWERAGITYRLESALGRDAALALGESLEPIG